MSQLLHVLNTKWLFPEDFPIQLIPGKNIFEIKGHYL